MPEEKFCELLKVVDSWSKHDKEYIWESSLKEDAPLYAHTALLELKRFRQENLASGRLV